MELCYKCNLNQNGSNWSTTSNDKYSKFKNKEKINLSNYLIKSLPIDLFIHLPKLKYINLSNNLINNITNGIFNQLIHLAKIDFSNNELTDLDENIFSNNENLRSIIFV